jgi:hypothetical protein
VFSGKLCIDKGSGFRERDVDDVKGRRNRERKDGIAEGLKAIRMLRRRTVVRQVACNESFRMTVRVAFKLDGQREDGEYIYNEVWTTERLPQYEIYKLTSKPMESRSK